MTKIGKIGWCALVTALLLAGLTACNKSADTSAGQNAAPVSSVADSDPAAGNLAPVGSSAPVSTAPQVAQNDSANYGNSAPPPDYSSQAASYPPSDSGYSDYDVQGDADSYPADSGYDTSGTQVAETDHPPPPLPEYSQPEAPGDNYYWTPGYWSYASAGYYWVPGTWVMVPWVNALWTPPYWGYDGHHYRWHGGYWGTHVGFYGGINYGFGYTGRGYYGAYWKDGTLNYNRAVTNVNASVVHNVYNYSVTNVTNNRISYNGGRGGINARPTPQEMAVVRDPRTPPVTAQVQYAREAAGNRAQFAVAGHAQPAALVAPRPLTTTYKAPAAKPPAAAMRIAAERTAPAQVPQGRPNEPQRPTPEGQPVNRPAPNQPAAASRPMPENRPGQPAPETRPAPEARPAPQPVAAQRPAPENHPVPPTPARPASEARQAPQPVSRPAPEAPRPAREAARPAPQVAARPSPQPAPRPAPENHLAPQPASRPAPEAPHSAPQVVAHPAPQQAPRPAPETRPAPQPAAHPAPAARPAPPPPSHPAPQAKPAPPPPAAHPTPAPAKKPEEKDKKEPPKE